MLQPDQYFWTFKYKEKAADFPGINIYPDEPESHYVYDTTVKNHNKVVAGDLVVIAGKHNLIGIARIEEIKTAGNVSKIRQRCPECNSQELAFRKNLLPHYKCRNHHEFEIPTEEKITVTQFTATYGSTFVPAPPGVKTRELTPYFINHNLYYSIQKTQLAFLTEYLPALATRFLSWEDQQQADPPESYNPPENPYRPDDEDTRKNRNASIPTREGQAAFRSKLFRRYGKGCMITGCAIEQALEASHIQPYRGKKDNHDENGILLRKDLHSLFDKDLFGIDPDSLAIRLHPLLRRSHYTDLEGKRLTPVRGTHTPSREALQKRWQIFLSTIPVEKVR